MKEVTKSGKTVEEALEAAVSELQTNKENVSFEVVEEPKKGFMGMGAKPAVVSVTQNPTPLDATCEFLQTVTEKMGVPATPTVNERNAHGFIDLSAQNAGLLIGKHGKTLNALQYLANHVANRHADEPIHITLDAEGYRQKREETLKNMAERLSEKAKQTGREVRLEAMPSTERKVIHVTLKDRSDIRTYSDGADPNRYVVITPSMR